MREVLDFVGATGPVGRVNLPRFEGGRRGSKADGLAQSIRAVGTRASIRRVGTRASIRRATADDAPRVLEMAQRFLAETPYGVTLAGTTSTTLAAVFDLALELGVIFVAESCCGRLDGFLAIAALTHPLTGRQYADELAWWVEPEARHGRVGVQLLAAAEAWTRDQKLGVLKMSAPAGSAVGRLYERRGYRAVETAYALTVEGG